MPGFTFWQSPRQRILSDPYYRLRNFEEVAIAAALGRKIDTNRASVDDWLRLPGISIHQARTLVQLTQSNVQFYCIEDIAAALAVPINAIKPWEVLLEFRYYELPGNKININRATIKELTSLLPTPTAKLIYKNRQQYGQYSNLAELQQRLNLSGELITQIMHHICF